eukprot:CAMPEP_0183788710 /NCGR_PEP_ID=MMETSP0739-20130205/68209_1 /TAXON_ID=385413 /ORGANISM="Thalassiosira miniscula, Strain CCMP1093" /LENGTH=153 /DNA_ID=CAMNT_0026032851 /DNA_START=75 /DNA_END=536 /DNA_ORIENTATION=+
MTAKHKMMCGCETCIIFEDMHRCVVVWRKRRITEWKKKMQNMRDGRRKQEEETKLMTYINQVSTDDEGHSGKHESAWDAALEMGCKPVQIGDRSYPHFSCVLNKCEKCKDCYKNMIHMDTQDDILYCVMCDEMDENKKRSLKGGKNVFPHSSC